MAMIERMTKILRWPGYRVYRSEINEAAKTLRLWVRRKRGNRKLECSRECLESFGETLSRARQEGAGSISQWSNGELWAEFGRRGEKRMVIRFERSKDGRPCDCPCCTAARNERAGA